MDDRSKTGGSIAGLLRLPIDAVFAPVRPRDQPKTPEELKARLGPMGDAAVERAVWGAILRWLPERPEWKRDPQHARRGHKLVWLYAQGQAAADGAPSILGKRIEAEYATFHRSRQSRIKKAAMELRAQWLQAGEQYLEASIIYVFGYMNTALAAAERN